jgi:hypothetical protein
MHEIADGFGRHATVAHDFVGTAVVGDDAIEDARMRRSVELKKEFAHGERGPGNWGRRSVLPIPDPDP